MIMIEMLLAAQLGFTTDIKPIIEKRCFPCHTGQVQSLPDLTIYKKAFELRNKIRTRVIQDKTMPPGGGSITEDERALIKRWLDEGAKE